MASLSEHKHQFSNTNLNGVSRKVLKYLNNNSFNLIYAISCKRYHIAETSNLIGQQINCHRNDIKRNRNKPVADYFNKPDYLLKNLRLEVTKKVQVLTKQQREVKE